MTVSRIKHSSVVRLTRQQVVWVAMLCMGLGLGAGCGDPLVGGTCLNGWAPNGGQCMVIQGPPDADDSHDSDSSQFDGDPPLTDGGFDAEIFDADGDAINGNDDGSQPDGNGDPATDGATDGGPGHDPDGDPQDDPDGSTRDPEDASSEDPDDGSTHDPEDASSEDPLDASADSDPQDDPDGSTRDPEDASSEDPDDGSTHDPEDASSEDPLDASADSDPQDDPDGSTHDPDASSEDPPDASTDGDPEDEDPPIMGCDIGQSVCSNQCVNTNTDHNHCGGCGIGCDPSELCSLGTCQLICNVGLSFCQNTCINLMGNDPDHCGACGNRCGTGLCVAGVCQEKRPGHVVLIGHDFSGYIDLWPSMGRLLSNAVHILQVDPTVAVFRGSADPQSVLRAEQAIGAFGKGWQLDPIVDIDQLGVHLENADVFLIHAQADDGTNLRDLGTTWRQALHNFLARERIVIVLDGDQGQTWEILDAAELLTVTGRSPVTGNLTVASLTDQIAAGLPEQFAFSPNTVFFHTDDQVVVVHADTPDTPVVIHKVLLP